MDCLCETCREFIYDNYSINNRNLKEIDKIFNNYTTSYNKKIDIYFIKCDFYLVFNDNFKKHIECCYVHNKDDLTKLKTQLLFWIEHLKLEGYSFCHINEMIIKTVTDKHWMTYKTYIQQPMPMVERRLNYIIHKSPQLIKVLDCSKNSPSIRKYSHLWNHKKSTLWINI